MPSRLILLATAIYLACFGARAAEPAAVYRIDLAIAWSPSTHPLDFPAGAHLTGLIGATHNDRYTFFGDGRTGSSGLESLAENGRSAIARVEMEDAQRRKRIGEIFVGDGLYPVPGTMMANFTATQDHGLVSFASMVAPSPDWFTGAAAVPLFVAGEWVERVELTLWAWDAGTNTGASYATDALDTQPRESIRLLATPHFLGTDGLRPIGKATLSLVK